MKKTIKVLLTLLPVAAITIAGNAQGLSFGVRAGLNNATVSVEEENGLRTEPESRLGLDLGLIINLGITEEFSIQPEIHYLQKGFKFEDEFLGNDIESRLTLNYLEVPVLAKYAFGGETLQGFINAGPSLGYALSGNSEELFNGEGEKEDIDFEEDEISRTDLSFLLGGGLSVNADPITIFLDIRYLLGLSNLDDTGDDESTIRNRGLGFGLGVLVSISE